ncbi:MAG: hypothetical protein ACLQUY_21300, partial [Ktedonobacterales bacterium]
PHHATRHLQDGIDIRTLQGWMGHRDIASKFSSDLPRYGRATGSRERETIGIDGNKNLGAEEGTSHRAASGFSSVYG